MTEEKWCWGRYAPDAWFPDRANCSIMVRGYLALRVQTPPSTHELEVWSCHLEKAELLVQWMRGSIAVPPPISFHYLGGEDVAVHQPQETQRLPPGLYVVLMVPVRSPYRNVSGEAERDAIARLDTAAGLVATFVSPNAVYQLVFEFLCEATGPGTRVMSPSIRRPEGPIVLLSEDTLRAVGEPMRAIDRADERLRARALTSLRWYAHALDERNSPDAFVKFWVALEALAFKGNGSPTPLTELLASSYERDKAWVRDTFAIDSLAQLRNDIVHSGQRPILHGNLLKFVDAIYVDALRARLGLTNERRAEAALPGGCPLRVPRWRNTGEIATEYLPDSPSTPAQSTST